MSQNTTAKTIATSIPPDLMSEAAFTQVLTPLATSAAQLDETAPPPVNPIKANVLVYISILLGLFQVIHFGRSLSQVNLAVFNNRKDCDTRQVLDGTCLMFPGQSSTEWLFVVNPWVVDGMFGAFFCGFVSDRFGRKRTLRANTVVMTIAAIIQASAPNPPASVVGRALAGIASSTATSVGNAYVSEVTLPHLRGALGSSYGFAIASGTLLISITFFFTGTESGWHYIAGFSIVIAAVFLVFAQCYMVESPSWLLLKADRTT
ncbi:hypothetical protein Poli38472_001160 [Pythium oligandrum]|uniref:Major facilitator superfamily (MFS) profile domain-containing protein n=1 Tax=Pythium oligandrum TaxID=41045 RepID=A0A8K1CTK6_PYTOL|nr:hypothetical protein Poli38472_001160 [Pythium oligandrum]|eukprot:TMW69004.1 hypothetical protein Poli38472_001160 [Pythium oligandrum]